jgi:tetratricopeptide (TPR) repeat protein
MARGVCAAAAAGLAMGALAWAGPAAANVTVVGGGFAADCSRSAKAVSERHTPHAEAIHECDLALDTEVLSTHEVAATHVNRGVLYLAGQKYLQARQDFDRAAALEPQLGEAYVNRGAALIGLGRPAEAVAEIDRGLALGAEEPEKAYFNRAIAKERLHDVKGAYLDYLKAAELKPDWDMPRTELERFQVTRK